MLATIAGEILIASNTSASKYSFAILVVTSGFFWLYSIIKKQEKKLVSLFLLFFLLDCLGFYCWVLKPLSD
jgi:biotin transporter BioY